MRKLILSAVMLLCVLAEAESSIIPVSAVPAYQ